MFLLSFNAFCAILTFYDKVNCVINIQDGLCPLGHEPRRWIAQVCTFGRAPAADGVQGQVDSPDDRTVRGVLSAETSRVLFGIAHRSASINVGLGDEPRPFNQDGSLERAISRPQRFVGARYDPSPIK
jgi:hypothetical protein